MSDDSLKGQQAPYRAKPFVSEFAPQIDALYREEGFEARKMSPEDKFLLGEQLFNFACEVTLAGISSQNPGAPEAECMRILESRLECGERLQRSSSSRLR